MDVCRKHPFASIPTVIGEEEEEKVEDKVKVEDKGENKYDILMAELVEVKKVVSDYLQRQSRIEQAIGSLKGEVREKVDGVVKGVVEMMGELKGVIEMVEKYG